MLPIYSHQKKFGILTHLREELYHDDGGYYHSNGKATQKFREEFFAELMDECYGEDDEKTIILKEGLDYLFDYYEQTATITLEDSTYAPKFEEQPSFFKKIIAFFIKIKEKLFGHNAKELVYMPTLVENSFDINDFFDKLRKQVKEIEQVSIEGSQMKNYMSELSNLIEQMQRHLDTLLNSTHSAHIEAKQDAKSMIDTALPQLFSSYFSSLIKASNEEKLDNTILFMTTMVKLEEKFCLLAKDVVEFEKEQRNLSLSETLQFVENRFLKEQKLHNTLSSHL